MATHSIFIPIKDVTAGDSFTLIGATYESFSDVSSDNKTYSDAAAIIAAYSPFANEQTFFFSGLESWVSAYNDKGFPNVIELNTFNNRIGHTLEFQDGETGILHSYGSGGSLGYRLEVNENYVRLTDNQFNVNSGVMQTPLVYDGTNLQYTVIIGTNIPYPSAMGHGFHFVYNGVNIEQLPRIVTPTQFEIDFWNGKYTTPTSDPYGEGGNSGTGGGTGTFDGTSDDIDIPGLPALSAADSGFITIFNPTKSQLQNLANYMWATLDLDGLKRLFANPMDCILGMSIVPVSVPTGGGKTVNVGNISTGVQMNVASSQYVEVDCGTINVQEFWGAYLDYDPYTKAEIYLPYCGTHPLSVDDIMGKAVTVKYHVDILSGACAAFVKCGGSVLYEFIGQCSSSIPITGNDWTNVINGVISIAGSIGTMVATGGASAPMAAGVIASTAINTMKPSVEKSGAMGGTGGMLAVQTPYLILTRPRQALPTNQNMFTGYPSFITETLGSISGYTEIESVHLENIPATEQELSEIENLMKGGVIF